MARLRAAELGVTDDVYAALLEAQGGGCAICSSPPVTRRLNVDHHHAKNGGVRGLLCHRCNRRLSVGITAEWLERAARYLRRYEQDGPVVPLRTPL